MKDAIVEGIKELVRTGVLAVIPVIIDGLATGEVNYKLAVTAGAIAVLRAIDKWLHASDVKSPLDLRSLDILKK